MAPNSVISFNAEAMSAAWSLWLSTQPVINVAPASFGSPVVVSTNLSFKSSFASTLPIVSEEHFAFIAFTKAAPTLLAPNSVISFNAEAMSAAWSLWLSTQPVINVAPASFGSPVVVSTNLSFKSSFASTLPIVSEEHFAFIAFNIPSLLSN